jgi:sugar phosphate isomerase/epimerase
MSLTSSSLEQIPICFASCSIGCKEEHTLPKRIDALADAGFKAIELSYPDLLSFARLRFQHDVPPDEFDELATAAKLVRAQCDAKGMDILMLQPFANFEGWPEGSHEKKEALHRARGWIKIMEACGCKMLQVGPAAAQYCH